MLDRWIDDPLWLAGAQAAVAFVFTVGVVLFARRQHIEMVGEATKAMLRGFIQIVAVGSILAWLLRGPVWTSFIVLLAMLTAAAHIAATRARGLQGAFRVMWIALLCGAGSVIAVMSVLGVLEMRVANLVPVGSMLLSNAMNSCAQLAERLRSDVDSNRGEVETALSLGASADVATQPYLQAAVRAAMIPQVNTMIALGVVSIPGLMSGMVLAGARPAQAAMYQFVVIALILSGSGLSAMVAGVLVRAKFFSGADQLVLPRQAVTR